MHDAAITLAHKTIVHCAVVSGSLPLRAACCDSDTLSPVFSFPIFYWKTTKLAAFTLLEKRLRACCLTILIYTFKCFKGATNPRYTDNPEFKGVGLYR